MIDLENLIVKHKSISRHFDPVTTTTYRKIREYHVNRNSSYLIKEIDLTVSDTTKNDVSNIERYLIIIRSSINAAIARLNLMNTAQRLIRMKTQITISRRSIRKESLTYDERVRLFGQNDTHLLRDRQEWPYREGWRQAQNSCFQSYFEKRKRILTGNIGLS